LLIVTSRFHTRRAGYIWRNQFGHDFEIVTIAAREDPFDPNAWWRKGRQIKQLLSEYGGWLFYLLSPKTDQHRRKGEDAEKNQGQEGSGELMDLRAPLTQSLMPAHAQVLFNGDDRRLHPRMDVQLS
jgi:hypothetical protein